MFRSFQVFAFWMFDILLIFFGNETTATTVSTSTVHDRYDRSSSSSWLWPLRFVGALSLLCLHYYRIILRIENQTLKEGKSSVDITRSVTIRWLVICERGHGLQAISADPSRGVVCIHQQTEICASIFGGSKCQPPLFPCPGSPTDRVTQSSNAVKAVTKMQKVPSASTSRNPRLVVRLPALWDETTQVCSTKN